MRTVAARPYHDREQRSDGERHDPEGYAGHLQPRAVTDEPHVGTDLEGVGGVAVGAAVGQEPADERDHHAAAQAGRDRTEGAQRGGDGERAACLGATTVLPATEEAHDAVQQAPDRPRAGARGAARGRGAAQQISHRPPILTEQPARSGEARG